MHRNMALTEFPIHPARSKSFPLCRPNGEPGILFGHPYRSQLPHRQPWNSTGWSHEATGCYPTSGRMVDFPKLGKNSEIICGSAH